MFKKALAVAVSATMILSMAVVASAETVSIEIQNPGPGSCVEDMETKGVDLTKPTATVTLVTKQTDDTKDGWGYGNFGANVNGAWTDSTIAKNGEITSAVADGEKTWTYTVEELVSSFGVTDPSAIANLKFGTWNGGELVSLTYSDGAAATGAVVPVAVISLIGVSSAAVAAASKKRK